MDHPALLQALFVVGGYLFNAASLVYTWVATRQKDHAQEMKAFRAEFSGEVEELGAEVRRQKERISAIEESFKHLPDKDSMHRLEMTVERLSGQLNVVSKSLESVDRVAQRIDTFLLENGRVAG